MLRHKVKLVLSRILDTLIALFGRVLSVLAVVGLLFAFVWIVEKTEIDWTHIEGQPISRQVNACRLINVDNAAKNYLEAINIMGVRAPSDAVQYLVVNRRPKFMRRYDCFANLSEEEIEKVMNTEEYSMTTDLIHRRLEQISGPLR